MLFKHLVLSLLIFTSNQIVGMEPNLEEGPNYLDQLRKEPPSGEGANYSDVLCHNCIVSCASALTEDPRLESSLPARGECTNIFRGTVGGFAGVGGIMACMFLAGPLECEVLWPYVLGGLSAVGGLSELSRAVYWCTKQDRLEELRKDRIEQWQLGQVHSNPEREEEVELLGVIVEE